MNVALLVLCLLWHAEVGNSVNASVPALSIPASEYFDGDDGWWSTFFVQVGTPPQAVRLLPGTSASAGDTIWVIIDQGCSEANPNLTNCEGNRGGTFKSNQSLTWSTETLSNRGLFQLNTFEEGKLGLTGNACYGFDTVTLGLQGSRMPTIKTELIAGIATNNYWLGSLGLSPIPFNITNLDHPIPSLLSNLWNQSYIPSLSWAYTAGAHYVNNTGVFGSLTLGGYDTSRFDASSIMADVAFGTDFSRDLVVQLNTITYDTIGSAPLLTQSIPIFIDSMVTQLWLPVDVCDAFAQAFNLTWNSTAQLYLIDDDVHDALVAQNPNFTFTLGSGTDINGTVDIVLPYAAFDLNVSQPIVKSTSRYFPLQQAQNDTQYTLGRVFLQEAYVIADYQRNNFSIAQASFPPRGTNESLVSIVPPGFTPSRTSSPSRAAIAGIVIGAALAIAFLAVGGVYFKRRKSMRNPQLTGNSEATTRLDAKFAESQPLQGDYRDNGAVRYELDDVNERTSPELGGGETKFARHVSHEMSGNEFVQELSGRPRAFEMATEETAAAELEAPLTQQERQRG